MSFSPSNSLTTLRSDLRDVMEAFDLAANRLGFVGGKILPFMALPRAAGQFSRVDLANSLQPLQDDKRAADGSYNSSNGTFFVDTYNCVDRGWEEPVDELERERYDELFPAEVMATARTYDMVLRNHEKRAIAAAFGPGVSSNAVATPWSNHASATPIADATAALILVRNQQCGVIPNRMVMDWETFMNVKQCEEVRQLIKYDGMDDPKMNALTASKIAEIIGVQEVVVAGGLQNTGAVNKTATLSALFDKTKVWFGRVEDGLNTREIQFGRTFMWDRLSGGEGKPLIETYPSPKNDSTVIRSKFSVHEKVINPQAATILTGVM